MLLTWVEPANGRSVVCKSLRGRFVMCVAANPACASRSRPAPLLRRTHRSKGERRAPATRGRRHIDR
ncbi:hypothetical protein C7S13_8263 [Burkholderia cepacia]|nr:hypothetical protein [Burkholderia cepacia]